MTSVERVFEYTELPPEAALDSDERHRPPPGWPQHGVISADDVSFRYTADAPLVLRHLRFCVRAPRSRTRYVRHVRSGGVTSRARWYYVTCAVVLRRVRGAVTCTSRA